MEAKQSGTARKFFSDENLNMMKCRRTVSSCYGNYKALKLNCMHP